MEAVNVLTDDPAVQEFLSLLEENGEYKAGFLSLLSQIGKMERHLAEAAREVTVLRAEVAGMREDAKHPLRAALTEAADRLEQGIYEAYKRLDAVKGTVLGEVKKGIAAIKATGLSALNGAVNFLGVKDDLAGLELCLNLEVKSLDKSIAKIEAVSAEYHEAGKHLRNVGRALAGKETVRDAKPMGKVAKTFRAPFRGARAAFSGAAKGAAAAIAQLERLEKAARPSVLDTIRDSKRQQPVKPTVMALEKPRATPEL